ncbi:M-phase phosphoprotein 8 [Dissostichus eleginoides]|uniref:M-phase phosphoprotein 8 n=1 Tax=Dissostichus eleginoides TaxID=100907 RepID=A0AAD9CHK8_DISEL|nr:M-phase phosphoprotein 8 [Dissostichus eleginoides]
MAAEADKVETVDSEQEEEVEAQYEVERIIDMRVEEGEVLYRVRWKNYCSDDDTWEPEAHLEDCREVLLAFKKNMAEIKFKKEAEAKKPPKPLPSKGEVVDANSEIDSDKDRPTEAPEKKPDLKKRLVESEDEDDEPIPSKKHKKEKGKEGGKQKKDKVEEGKKRKGKKDRKVETSEDEAAAPLEENQSDGPSESQMDDNTSTDTVTKSAEKARVDDKSKLTKGKLEVRLQGIKDLIQDKKSKKPDAAQKESSLQKLKSLTSKVKEDTALHSDSSDSSTLHKKAKSKAQEITPAPPKAKEEEVAKEELLGAKDATGSTNLFEKFLLNCEAKDRAPRRQPGHQAPPEKTSSKPTKLIGKIEKIPKTTKESPAQKAESEKTEKNKQSEASRPGQSFGFSLDSEEREAEETPAKQKPGEDSRERKERSEEDSQDPPGGADKSDKGQATLSLGMDLNLDWMTLDDFQKHLNGDDEILSGPPLSPSELREAVKSGDYMAVKLALNSKEEYNLDQEIRYSLKRAAEIAFGESRMTEDSETESEQDVKKVEVDKSTVTEDLMKLHTFITGEEEEARKELKESPNLSTWKKLSEATLADVCLFNRGRLMSLSEHEVDQVSKMLGSSSQECYSLSKNALLLEEMSQQLLKMDRTLPSSPPTNARDGSPPRAPTTAQVVPTVHRTGVSDRTPVGQESGSSAGGQVSPADKPQKRNKRLWSKEEQDADSSGMSLSMLAAAGGQDDILRLLIRKGVKVNGRQKNGTTALMHAAEKNFLTTVAILLEAGSCVNAQTLSGETALMKACKRGNADVVRLLLEYGADCNIMSKTKTAAMYFAKLGNNLMVCDLIKDHVSMLASVAEDAIRAYFESRLVLLEPVFPLACHRLCEGPDFSLEFGFKSQPQQEGSGILLFIFHANFLNEITARLCGPCSVHAVVLNDKFQLPIFLDSHFIYSFSPAPGINRLFIRLAEVPTAKVKLLICAYRVQLP